MTHIYVCAKGIMKYLGGGSSTKMTHWGGDPTIHRVVVPLSGTTISCKINRGWWSYFFILKSLKNL